MADLNLKDFADLPLVTDEGTAVTLADYLGQRVLVFSFPRANTPGCTAQACGFRDAAPQIEAAGARVLGLSTDKPKDLAKWKADKSLPYTLLSDPDHAVLDRLGAFGERSMMGRKYMGTIRSHFIFNQAGDLIAIERGISPKDSIAKGVAGLVKI